MKTILTTTFLLIFSFCFSKDKEKQKQKKHEDFSYVCCTKSATGGEPGTSTWVRVEVTKCVQGTPATAGHEACAFAQSAASSQLRSIQSNMTHTLTIE